MNSLRTPFQSQCGIHPAAILLLSLALLTTSLWAQSESSPGKTSRPNILLIVAEDMSTDINPYRDMPFDTPGIDELADAGAVFENAWAAQASCSPSRASMFTGLYPHAHGQIGLKGRGSRIQPGTPTFMDALRAAGYLTAVTYKLHVEPEPAFDIGPKNTAWGDPEKLAAVAERTMDEAAEQNRPWFLMLNTFDTHGIDNKSASKLKNLWRNQYAGKPADPLTAEELPLPPYLADSEVAAPNPNLMENLAAYYNSVRRVDDLVARALKALDERGLRENTIIIFTSDHGPVWPRGKQMVYEVSLHVPLIVVAPEAEPGSRRTELVSLVDIMPTITELAGGQAPELPSDARSLMRTLSGDAQPRAVMGGEFFQHWGPKGFFPSYAIRTERYKLNHNLYPKWNRPWKEYHDIPFMNALPAGTDEAFATAFRHALRPPEFELYDLESDPWEYRDLSADPRYANVLSELKQQLADWRALTGDPFLDQQVLDQAIALHRETARQTDSLAPAEAQAVLDQMAVDLNALMRTETPIAP
ncbi:sulfatase [Ruficoccus amylovorans]|uniref:Sulfatase n=1 Tax=Ruficoccus amylovorans TaxID=1804625 RepID=A0A842HHD2_9BACT|nr:sulfatase [Ruficoccus amylovorans]MBC2594974.1 sulfatase [Ruficoccus amylovorans]